MADRSGIQKLTNTLGSVVNPATEETLALIKAQTDKLNFTGLDLRTVSTGGGSAVSIADGADVVSGTIADAIVAAGAAGTLSAKLRRITQGLEDLKAGITTLPLPTGAATSALQTTGNTSTGSIDTKTPALGQALGASSIPVVLTAIQVTALTPPAAITGFNLETTQSAINTKLPSGLTVTASRLQVELPAGGTGLTNTELRASAVPVSGTVSVNTISGFALDSTVAKDGTDITTPTAMPAGGVGIRGWLSAIWTKINGTLAVTGTFFQTTQPVSGTFFQATQPVSLATAPSTPVTNAGTFAVQSAATLAAETTKVIGTVNIAAAQTVATVTAVTAITNALPTGANVIGALSANQSINNAQVGGVAISTGSGVTGTGVQRVTLATDVALPAGANQIGRVEQIPAILAVTATGAAAAAVTLTIPAVASQFHYITRLNIIKYASVATVGAAAATIVTSTNIPGSIAWTTPTALPIGTQYETDLESASPIRSSTVNTATTIVCPATTGIIWRVNVFYYAAV